jgi:four helix bundle protein
MAVKGEEGRAAKSFEELFIYQRARELTNGVYRLTRQGPFAQDHGLVDQVRRAAVSVMSNIAEGFERGTKTEFVQFLYIAKGSCGEVRAQLQIARDQEYVPAADFDRLHELAHRTSGMISKFIAHLERSSYQGEKIARPQRQAINAQQDRLAALRAAQDVNMRRQSGRPQEEHGQE